MTGGAGATSLQINPPMIPEGAANASPLATGSRFYQRLQRRYEAQLPLLPAGAPRRESLALAYGVLREQGTEHGAALRTLRQLVMHRLIELDCDQQQPLEVITACVTELAEFALDQACIQAFDELDARHGKPMSATGQRAQLWVIGMGKLGARELNVSSDIDLIYVYDDDGETTGTSEGRGRISNHEYFSRAVRQIYSLIGDTTEHGFVFRVDLALRPNGNSGPPAVSLGALEEYFLVQGREWERFAWLKSRVVAPRTAIDSGSARALRSTVLPFVFRRYLDYNVFESLRTLHRQIREHAARRSAGHPERANDVKLSRGGIREVEFTVQLLQVVRGGQFPELRTRPTLDALQRLARAGLMPQATADALAAAYVFLRRVEHRIQYLEDQQTHVLPTDDANLTWIARTMGFPTCCPFLSELDRHRELVAQEFDRLLGGANGQGVQGLQRCRQERGHRSSNSCSNSCRRCFVSALRYGVTTRASARLRDESRTRLMRLVQRTAQWVNEGRASEEAAVRLADWIEPLLRRESYLALLLERPSVHERLLRLLGSARWPARYLLQHPGVIDELASDDTLNQRFDAAEFERELEDRRNALRPQRRGRRRRLAQSLAPRAPCRGLSHAGARCRGPPQRRTGGRRPERDGRCRCCASPRDGAGSVCATAPPEPPTSRSSATANSAARSWATAATWISCSCTRTTMSARRRPMPPSCASSSTGSP